MSGVLHLTDIFEFIFDRFNDERFRKSSFSSLLSARGAIMMYIHLNPTLWP